jgi:hypothetical protein
MNTATDPKEMDIYFKNGVIRCKHCGATKKVKWPITLQDVLDGVIDRDMKEFQLAHTNCALQAFGLTTN